MLLLGISAAFPAASAAPGADLAIGYNAAVHGDFVTSGNTVTECPQRPGRYPVRLCRDAQGRRGSGVAAQNNGHPMAWADVDQDPATYNSSAARVSVPPGADIAYAKLTWAGNTGEPAGTPCTGQAARPPGTPRDQAVSVAVADRRFTVAADRFTADDPADFGGTDQLFYSAMADLTEELRGLSGELRITVGNVWTPQGYDCFGGWSVVVVWAFDGPRPQHAPARKRITVYDGHLRVSSDRTRAAARATAIRPAGGTSRAAVTGYEGDWAVTGDALLVNDRNAAGTDNILASAAEGRIAPDHANNMSVDVRTFDVGADVVRAGDTSADLVFTGRADYYLVQSVTLATPLPELTAETAVDRPVAHPGDDVTQTVTVTNTGGAPAADVVVRPDLAAGCDQRIGRIEPGRSATVTCAGKAGEQDHRPSAVVTGTSLAGDPLDARAETPVDVIHPALTVTKSAAPTTVLTGQDVRYEVTVRNTGDTPLSDVSVDDKQVDECDNTKVEVLAPGAATTLRCKVTAGDDGFTNTVTASGRDQLGTRVAHDAQAAFSVVFPRITLSVVPSTNAVRPGEPVGFTVTVGNPSTVPLGQVRVTGTPSACARALDTLHPGQSATYTCRVAVTRRLTTALTASAIPLIDGQPVAGPRNAVQGSVTVVVSVIPPDPPAMPPPPPVAAQPVAPKATESPLRDPVSVAILVAGLAVLCTFVTVGAIAASAGRPGK